MNREGDGEDGVQDSAMTASAVNVKSNGRRRLNGGTRKSEGPKGGVRLFGDFGRLGTKGENENRA